MQKSVIGKSFFDYLIYLPKDYNEKKAGDVSQDILKGLGGTENISDLSIPNKRM